MENRKLENNKYPDEISIVTQIIDEMFNESHLISEYLISANKNLVIKRDEIKVVEWHNHIMVSVITDIDGRTAGNQFAIMLVDIKYSKTLKTVIYHGLKMCAKSIGYLKDRQKE